MRVAWLFFLFLFLAFEKTSACTWVKTEQLVSEFTKDKVIFWGRPLNSYWVSDNNSAEEFYSPQTFTEIEVIKPIRGDVPRKIKVRHDLSSASCGFFYGLGYVSLIIVDRHSRGNYFADETTVQSAPNRAVVAYLSEGIDVSALGAHYSYQDFDYDDKCKKNSQNNDETALPSYCIAPEIMDKIYEIYEREYALAVELSKKKSWWQRFLAKR